MSGTDELFPDATPLDETAAYDAPPTSDVPRRGLGIAALIIGILAILGDVIGIAAAFITLASAAVNVQGTLDNVDNSLGAFIGVIVLEFTVFLGGIVFGALALILGLVAAVRRRGRVPGVVGAVFGFLVLATHAGLGIFLGSSAANIPGLTG